MESIGDLLKKMPQRKLLEDADKRFAAMLQQPTVQQLLAAHPEVKPHEWKRYMNSIHQMLRDEQHCAHCPGLAACPNDYQGHHTRLSPVTNQANLELVESREPCVKLRAKKSEEQLKARIRSYYVSQDVLLRSFSATDILATDLERAKAVQHLLTYIIKTKESGLQSNGLYLYGPFGTGKTFLMCYLLHELAQLGHTGAIVYMPDFVEDVKAMIQEPQRLRETVETLKTMDILVFDDLGAENLSPWVRDHVFGAILNERMGRKPTFFTSNFDLTSLQKHFSFTSKEGDEEHKGQRLMERIKPFVELIFVGGSNKRGVL
jgi:primosomal protein DnaI